MPWVVTEGVPIAEPDGGDRYVFGIDVAQQSLWFGVDDLDGTVQGERIYHMAGARTPEAMTTEEIRRLILDAGREPFERDTLYNLIGQKA